MASEGKQSRPGVEVVSDDEIINALKQTDGKVSEAAELLPVSDKTVYYRARSRPAVGLYADIQKKTPQYELNEVMDALIKAEGSPSKAAKILGCSRATVTMLIGQYIELEQAMWDHHGEVFDLAQEKLVACIKREEPWAISFYFRFYFPMLLQIQKNEIEVLGLKSNGMDQFDFDRLDEDELREFIRLVGKATGREEELSVT